MGLKGKHKLADRWERSPYVIISQPNPDIPVYEVHLENSRSKKNKILHRNLLLPFSCLPIPRVEPSKVSGPATTLAVPTAGSESNESGSMFSEDNNSERGYDGGISSCSVTDTAEANVSQPYIIPVRRKQGQPGLSPRSTVSTTASESSSGEENKRPQRSRKKPSWMDKSQWVFAQPFTFTVEPEDVIYL